MAVKNANTMDRISQIIAYHRKASGLSRVDLADLAGVGKTVLFDIEHGKGTVRFESIRRVLDALNITLRLESPLMSQFMEQMNEER